VNEFSKAMNLALELYRSGEAVVLKDKNSSVIHGQVELTALGLSKCRLIPDIDILEWKASEKYWQEILRGARLAWLQNQQ
jgi:hypothetical protein